MAGVKKALKRRPSSRAPSRDTGTLVQSITSIIEREGAYPIAALAKATPDKKQHLEVFDALIAAGFEVGAKHARQPLDKQLDDLLRSAGPVALRSLDSELRGASPREAKEAAADVVERGRARVVARGRDLFLAPHGAAVLDAAAQKRLTAVATELLAMTRVASKKGAALLRADIDALLQPFRPSTATTTSTTSPGKPVELATAITKHREASGLTSVPKLVRLLGGTPARDAIHAELLRGARAGRFELRPESGAGRMSAEDRDNCIPGPQGSRLSWVRLIEESS